MRWRPYTSENAASLHVTAPSSYLTVQSQVWEKSRLSMCKPIVTHERSIKNYLHE